MKDKSENQETIADIVREMRELFIAIKEDSWSDYVHVSALTSYADRLDAAAGREGRNSLRLTATSAVAMNCDPPAADAASCVPPAQAPGNAAAMREALEAVSRAFDDRLICTDWQMTREECDRLDAVRDLVKQALVAPARNCDRFATAKEAMKAWRVEDGGRNAYHEWLFAPASEREAAANKQKKENP